MSNRRSTWSRDRTSRRATAELALGDAAGALQQALDEMSEREAAVIRLRFGLRDGQPKTLDEIGAVYGVTRERIRQIEATAMSKLRDPMFAHTPNLADALEVFDTEDFGSLPEWIQSRVLPRDGEAPQPDLRFCQRHNAHHLVTLQGQHPCGWCGCLTSEGGARGGRPRTYCSNSCKQAAYRRRLQPVTTTLLVSKNLTRAHLTSASLQEADLTDADLRDAGCFGADLRNANLTGANLTGANLDNTDLTGADLTRADLTRAYLRDANLGHACLAGADLTRADLTRADLRGAKLAGAKLHNAHLTGADLTGARLARATGLRDYQLTRIQLRTAASLPPALRAKPMRATTRNH